MYVVDGLSGEGVAVHYQTITGLVDTQLFGDLGGGQHQFADQCGLLGLEVVGGGDMFTRDAEDVVRRLRM